jgi:hypothetical protein
MQEQVDALGVEFAQEVQQVDQRPAQAIDRPGCDYVDRHRERSECHGATVDDDRDQHAVMKKDRWLATSEPDSKR